MVWPLFDGSQVNHRSSRECARRWIGYSTFLRQARSLKIPIAVPVWRECSRCHGTGRARTLICGLCRGKGRTRTEERISVIIPPKVEDGMRIKVPIPKEEIDLVVTLRVTD